MKIINKRRLKDFRNTSKIFLRNNFYYKLEQYIIKYLIINICPSYLSEFRKNIDKIVINLLKIDNNEDIKKHLEYCFLIKLKNFADERNIKMEQPKFDFKENYNSSSDIKNKIKDEILIKNDEEKTDDISDKESEYDIKINFNKSKIEEEQWFIFNNSKNINNEILSKFLNFVNTQESDFNKKTNDIPLNKLNEYIRNDLMNFFDTNKKDFIKNKIDNIYIKKNFNFEINIIKDILKEEKFKSIYHNKFNEEFELLIQNNNITKIDYLTIIIVGKSGVGKSTLINNMLKLEGEKKAQTDVCFPVTKATTIFKNEKIPFLNLIDTPGIEHSEEFNPENILKNVNETDKELKSIAKKENEYNKYIQCIWYCIKDSDIQDIELNLIKELKNKLIPLIIIYTNSINMDNVKKIKNKIKEKFNDLPFIDVLAEKNKNKAAYGLNDLLKLTLDICQKYKKGNIYKHFKNIISKEIIDKFKEKNNKIKNIVDEQIIKNFSSKFLKVLNNEEELLNNIFKLYEIYFLEFLKDKDNKNELDNKSQEIFTNSKNLNSLIHNFISLYKKEVENIIEKILAKKTLEYLDIQVKKEKDENISIKCENKKDKKDFNDHIKIFLNNYFYFISQKYIIYYIIYNTSGSFSNNLVKEVNDYIESLISSEKDLFKKNFTKKFENFKEYINKFKIDNKIYDCNDNKKFKSEYEENNNENNHNENDERKELRASNLDAPMPIMN